MNVRDQFPILEKAMKKTAPPPKKKKAPPARKARWQEIADQMKGTKGC